MSGLDEENNMTLEIFSRDFIPIIGVFVAAIGLIFVWWQIRSAAKSIELTSQSLMQASESLEHSSNWNKINSTYNFFDLDRNTKIEEELYTAGDRLKIKFDKELTPEELEKLTRDSVCFLKAKEFLNDFESYCAAYQIGALDKELAYQMLGTRVAKEFRVFYPLVEHLRNRFGDLGILIELENTANEWSARLKSESDAIKAVVNNIGVKENEHL